MRLAPDARLVCPAPHAVQLCSARGSVDAQGLEPRSVELVRLWASDARPDSAALLRVAAGYTEAAASFARMVDLARTAGLGADSAVDGLHAVTVGSGSGASPRTGPHSTSTTAAPWRGSACVGLVGSGVLGALVARSLADAGVGRLQIDDPRPVEATDTGPLGHDPADVGAVRAGATARRITETSSTRAAAGQVTGSDVVVLVSALVTDPTGTAHLICEGVPHVAVTYGPRRTQVGPLVVPGRTPCLNCLDLHHGDRDASWSQTWRELRRSTVTARPRVPGLLAATAAAQTAAVVLGAIDRGLHLEPPHELPVSVSTTTRLPDLVTELRSWSVHPRCGCADMAPSRGGGDADRHAA